MRGERRKGGGERGGRGGRGRGGRVGKGEDREEGREKGEGGSCLLCIYVDAMLLYCLQWHLCTCTSILLLFRSLLGMQSHQSMAQGWRGLPRVRSIHV